MRIFNFRFFGILEICFFKTKNTDAHVPKAFSASSPYSFFTQQLYITRVGPTQPVPCITCLLARAHPGDRELGFLASLPSVLDSPAGRSHASLFVFTASQVTDGT
jgi:hypothetical protein